MTPDEARESGASSVLDPCDKVAQSVGATRRPVRIAIASDEPIFAAGLRRLLGDGEGCTLVDEPDDVADVVERVAEAKADLLFLDHSLAHAGACDLLRELDHRRLAVRTVIVCREISSQGVVEWLEWGASGVLLKSASRELVFKCVEAVMHGEYWVDRAVTGDLVAALRHLRGQPGANGLDPAALSGRDREILGALVHGKSNKAIARLLGISEQTVKNHLSHLYGTLGVSSRMALVLIARERGLV